MTVSPKRSELAGLWTAIHTPFDAEHALDEAGLRQIVRHLSATLELDGVFCSGIMGEFWSLTLPERARLLDVVVAEAHPAMQVSAMTTHHSLSETVELSRHAERAGVDFIALMNPFIGPRSDDAVHRYFATICGALSARVVLFVTPAFGYSMSADLAAQLAAIPNVCAMKCTGPRSETARIRALCGDRMVISDPEEAHWLDNLSNFGQQALYADPEPYLYQRGDSRPIAEYTAAFRAGNIARATEIAESIAPMRRVYAKWIIDPLKAGSMPNAALKCWAEAMGLASGPVRTPLAPLSETERRELLFDLAGAGLL